jgi:hypothetical protein
VPINTRWKVAEVVDAADAYAARTGRRYSIEYALIRDVNDQPGGPTCSAGCWPAGWRTSTSSRSTRRRAAEVGRQPAAGRARVRPPPARRRRPDDGARHPRPGDRRRLRPARRIGRQMPLNAAVRIGAGSWLGAGAVVLPGACIGRNVVIAAGSVVRGTVPDHCVVAGVPARVVRSYIPGIGWSVSAESVSAELGAVAVERVEGVAQAADPPG